MRSPIFRLLLAACLGAATFPTFAEDFQLPEVCKVGENGLISSALIYSADDKPTPQCHASTLAETGKGLVAAWFGGTREKHDDVGIWVSRHDGQSWSQPVQVADGSENEEKDFPCWNPVLFQPQEGPLLLFYKVGPSPSQWWGAVMTSADHGKTWSPARKLGRSSALGEKNQNLIGPVKNKPVELADDVIICPSSTEHQGWRVHFELSRDLGETWEVIGPINDASQFDAIQPSVLNYADGRLQILCRTRQGVVGQSWSEDMGKTWSKMSATPLPNPNAGTDAVTLADGRQLLVYNHTTRDGLNRRMLNVAVSPDGKSWTPTHTLEKSDGRGEYSYPAVIQTKDGMVHITYTWQRQSVKHAVLDPKKF